MLRSCYIAVVVACIYLFQLTPLSAAPNTFETAKTLARQQVYHDRTSDGTLYCGCNWEWTGRSGGRVDHASCGYQTRAQATRAARIEWEHIVPASLFGQQRQCWQQGGRNNCKQTDPLFNRMEADLHNLSPVVGEINADRSNYRFGMLPGISFQHGRCDFKVDFSARVAEPRDAVKGQVARVWFYMHDRYNLNMAKSQQQLLMAWDRQYPPSNWELQRDQRISRLMGHSNLFVTGAQQWQLNHRNSKAGLNTETALTTKPKPTTATGTGKVIGNKNSKVYHLPQGCPSYHQVSSKNIRWFDSESDAQRQGYRRAGNCR